MKRTPPRTPLKASRLRLAMQKSENKYHESFRGQAQMMKSSASYVGAIAAGVGLRSAAQIPSKPDYFVDASRYRITQPLNKQQWECLRSNCKSAYMLDRRDKNEAAASIDFGPMFLPRNYIKGYLNNPLVVVKPNTEALLLLNKLSGVMLNYVELARDQIVADSEQVHDRFNRHFVHRWHGKHQTVFRVLNAHGEDESYSTTGTSYSGQRRRGHIFAWYSDRPSKVTGECSCFHVEGRYQGEPALNSLGINCPADLINFPHEAHWQKNLEQLYAIDFARLGRYERNRRRRERRRKSNILLAGKYNADAAYGGVLYRVFGRHPDQPYQSVQQYLDVYKPPSRDFLVPIRLSDLIDPMFSPAVARA